MIVGVEFVIERLSNILSKQKGSRLSNHPTAIFVNNKEVLLSTSNASLTGTFMLSCGSTDLTGLSFNSRTRLLAILANFTRKQSIQAN